MWKILKKLRWSVTLWGHHPHFRCTVSLIFSLYTSSVMVQWGHQCYYTLKVISNPLLVLSSLEYVLCCWSVEFGDANDHPSTPMTANSNILHSDSYFHLLCFLCCVPFVPIPITICACVCMFLMLMNNSCVLFENISKIQKSISKRNL